MSPSAKSTGFLNPSRNGDSIPAWAAVLGLEKPFQEGIFPKSIPFSMGSALQEFLFQGNLSSSTWSFSSSSFPNLRICRAVPTFSHSSPPCFYPAPIFGRFSLKFVIPEAQIDPLGISQSLRQRDQGGKEQIGNYPFVFPTFWALTCKCHDFHSLARLNFVIQNPLLFVGQLDMGVSPKNREKFQKKTSGR